MPEWSIGAVSKTVDQLAGPRVRIPVSPQKEPLDNGSFFVGSNNKTIIMPFYEKKQMSILKKIWFLEKMKKITLSSGQSARDYVLGLPKQHREVAAKSILECLRLNYPLNNMEITCKARELNRKRLGIF